MSSISQEVYLGFWTNWSHGKIQGATVTMTRQHGGFLIAFLAVFIGAAGKSFWRLGCFILHRHFSSSQAQDGLYHQRQTILRNSDTAQDGAWRLLLSMLAWRSGQRAQRPIWRLLPIILVAFAVSAAFGVASIFSSNVTSETLNQVLLKGTRCGTLNDNKPNNTFQILSDYTPYTSEKSNRMLTYAYQCYTNETQTDGCNLYIKPRLPLISTRGQPCPFGDGICKLDSDNLILDSGILDSQEDLGINTASKDRFQVRMVHKCAPLKTEQYQGIYNDSYYGETYTYKYGGVTNPVGKLNFTFVIPNKNTTFLPSGKIISSADIPRLEYSLGSAVYYATNDESLLEFPNRWTPIPSLRLDDADTHLIYLSAPEIRFATPVLDPWLTARTGTDGIYYQEGDKPSFAAYTQDDPVGVMACAQQVQYCNPNLPEGQRCEPLRGVNDPRRSASVKKLFTRQSQFDILSTADNVWRGNAEVMSGMVGRIGAAALLARYSLSYGFSGPLPRNQWQLEAEYWVKGFLTSVQDAFLLVAGGPPESMEAFRDVPLANDTAAQTMCHNQKIVSTKYSSFNVLGVSLILILGAIIIVLDMSLEPIVGWWQRRKYQRGKGDNKSGGDEKRGTHPLYSTIEWTQTNMLQLQRLAHEEAGYGEWSKCDQDVPVTEAGQLIAPLDLNNISHPRLLAQRGTPTPSEWEGILPTKPWAVGRSDTGIETLIEEAEGEKGKKIEAKGGHELEIVVHAVSDEIEPRGLGVQVDSPMVPATQDNQAWRTLR